LRGISRSFLSRKVVLLDDAQADLLMRDGALDSGVVGAAVASLEQGFTASSKFKPGTDYFSPPTF